MATSFEATSKMETLFHEALTAFLSGLVEINSSFTQMNTLLEATRKRQDFCEEQSATSLAVSLLAFFGFVVFLGYINPNPVLIVNQEMIREWETLFRKAKLFDALLVKQQVLSQKRRRSKRHSKTSLLRISEPELLRCNPKIVTTEELLAMKQSRYGEQSGSEQEVYVEAIEDSNPRFASTEEMLEIKHNLYDEGESFC
ncbi:hypothetical protein quinque_003821 [Culex quinquefasciatus]